MWKWGPEPIMQSVMAAGIEPGDVQFVLNTDPRWPREARQPDTGLVMLTIWGRTSSGRAILVATRPLDGRDWEIIGARPLSTDELAELERWEARRRGR